MRSSTGWVGVAALFALVAGGCGGSGGGGFSSSPGAGAISITAFAPATVPGGVPVAFTITGTNFVTGTGTFGVPVRFHALGGATPFAGGTSDTADVIGTVVNSTTITGTTPAATVCGVASIAFEVTVVLESGVRSNTFSSGGGGLTFTAPTVASVAPNPIPAEIPTVVTVTGTGFGPVGSTALVRFVSDGVPASPPLFGDAADIETTAPGSVASSTTITLTAPLAAVCGVLSRTASIQVTLSNGSCSALAAGVLTYSAPTLATTNNPSVPCLTPGAFVLTGTGFPVGATIQLTFTQSGSANPLFVNGTQTTTVVSGTVASATTITGTYPAATICGSATRTAVVRAAFPAGSCADSPPTFVTFRAPQLTSIATAQPGNALRETLATAFTLTGTDLVTPVPAFPIVARYSGGGTIYQVDANGVGTAQFDDVPMAAINATTAIGTSPVVQATSSTPLSTFLQLAYPDGTCTNPLAVTWAPPPLVTDVATNLLVREHGAAPANRSFLTHTETFMTITGTSFDPLAVALVYKQANGPAGPIGTGALAAPTVTGTTTIAGGSPLDPSIQVDEQAAVKVTNPDGQSGTFTAAGFQFRIAGHLQSTNTTVSAADNAEMDAAINPVNPRNMVSFTHDLSGPNMLLLHSENAGRTWTSRPIGSGDDGVAGGFRSDPRAAYDRFGNLYVNYLANIGAAAERIVVLQSFDNGATFPNAITVASDPGSNFDKNFLVIGPDGANLAQDAIYAGWDDNGGAIVPGGATVVSGATVTGAGVAPSAFSAPITPVDAPGAGSSQFANAAVGPNGDLYVVWNETSGDVTGQGPLPLFFDRDPQGLFAGAGFGTDILLANTNVGSFDAIPASPNRTIFANPSVTVVRAGPKAGRVVFTYGDENPNESDDTDILSVFSDNGGATLSAPVQVNDDITVNSQFLAEVRSDPVTGLVVSAWYDTRNDLVNNKKVQVFGTTSLDYGATWEFNRLLSDGQSDESLMTNNFEYLDYLGLAVWGESALVTWTDNSNSTGDNPSGNANTEDYVTRFQVR